MPAGPHIKLCISHQINSLNVLRTALQEEWKVIPQKEIRALISNKLQFEPVVVIYIIKLGSHELVKQVRVLPTGKLVVITTTCELTVVKVVDVHTLKKYSNEISVWLEIARQL